MADHYTTERIAAHIRDEIDDLLEPYLVPDARLAEVIDIAQRELSEVTLCLQDGSTFSITTVADQPFYDLDPQIISIREAFALGARQEVTPITLKEISGAKTRPDYGLTRRDWRSMTGSPEYFVTDISTDKVRAVPVPVAVDTIELFVHKYSDPIEDLDCELTIPDRYRPAIIIGALAILYRTQDSELYDPKLAREFKERWDNRLDEEAAKVERQTRGPGVVQFNRQGVW